MDTEYWDLFPWCGERTVHDALDEYFDRKTLMGIVAGGSAGKIIEKLYAIIVVLVFGTGNLGPTIALLGLWTLGLVISLYLAAHWHIITDLYEDERGEK